MIQTPPEPTSRRRTDTEIAAWIEALQQQRNGALDQVAQQAGTIALLQDKIAHLEGRLVEATTNKPQEPPTPPINEPSEHVHPIPPPPAGAILPAKTV